MLSLYLIGIQSLGEYLRGIMEDTGVVKPIPPPSPVVAAIIAAVPGDGSWGSMETLAIPILIRVIISILVAYAVFLVYDMMNVSCHCQYSFIR